MASAGQTVRSCFTFFVEGGCDSHPCDAASHDEPRTRQPEFRCCCGKSTGDNDGACARSFPESHEDGDEDGGEREVQTKSRWISQAFAQRGANGRSEKPGRPQEYRRAK